MLTPEQTDLRDTLRGYLASTSPEPVVRDLMTTDEGYSRKTWRRFATELGLPGLLVPERWGGLGLGAVELYVAMAETGRVLLCAPLLSSAVLATRALLTSGDEDACARWLPDLAAGTRTGTLAVTERPGRWAADDLDTRAEPGSGGTYALTGEKWFVLDGHTADVILVAATVDDAVALFEVTAGAPGLTRAPSTTLDATRKQARLGFDRTPARLVGDVEGAAGRLRQALATGALALAAEQVGGAREALERSVAYAKVREQFGRPVGSFQAIKHKCADMLLRVESADTAAHSAARATDDAAPDADVLASMAKSYCSETYLFVAAEMIQIHGGIGFTWEHPAHLYFKRAKSSQLLLGSPGEHRELVLASLGL